MRNASALIVSIGDEVLSGHTVNTNSSFIALELYNTGIKTERIITIPDKKEDIKSVLHEESIEHDLIFVTGGLGPTHDDRTKKIICDMFGYQMSFRMEIWKEIVNFFEKKNRKPDMRNKEQALFPDSPEAEIIRNSCGTAPGIMIRRNSKYYFIMPGVPAEMRSMMIGTVLPLLKKEIAPEIIYNDINTTDIPESTLYSILSGHKKFPFGCEIAFLPQGYGVTVRLKYPGSGTVSQNILNKAVHEVSEAVKQYIFGYDIKDPASELVCILKEKGLRITAAESCTGGLLMKKITDIPGASSVFDQGFVTYSNESKSEILAVGPHTLGTYGAVSEETVEEMLQGLLAVTDADIAAAVSGIAGPDGGTPQKPAGTVYSGFSTRKSGKPEIRCYHFAGDRETVRERSADKLIVDIIKHLKGKSEREK